VFVFVCVICMYVGVCGGVCTYAYVLRVCGESPDIFVGGGGGRAGIKNPISPRMRFGTTPLEILRA